MTDFVPTREQESLLAHDPAADGRVLAGPGTGKSATLVALIERLAAGARPPRLRLLTFTRAATGELAKKVSEHPTLAAERPSTIHSFAISVLVRNPGAAGLPEPLRIADDWEFSHIVRRTLAIRAGVGVRQLDRLVREMAANWESLVPSEDPEVAPGERARFLAAWGEHRRVYGYTLLQELPYALRAALRDHPDLDGTDFDLLIVDEYQDLNACDLDVIKRLAEHGCAVIGAGDDDQSIYSFRKAAPEGIRRFIADYPGAQDYALSVTQRCGRTIVEWATFVIAGDLDRPPRPPLQAIETAPNGEVGLLAYYDQAAEARGIASIVDKLIHDEGISPSEILILLRGDHNGTFSGPIKAALERLHIPFSDPDAVGRVLAEDVNRRTLATFRLLVSETDSLAWATLLRLEPGVGETIANEVYRRAVEHRRALGEELLAARDDGFPAVARAPARRAADLVDRTRRWLGDDAVADRLAAGDIHEAWGHRIVEMVDDDELLEITEDLRTLLLSLDEYAERGVELDRFIGQISPLGKDLERNQSAGVRIMTMAGAKGLTVRATIVAALEEGIMPRPDADLAEERRLLYVALTRARAFVFGTWARRRTGPTARAGRPRVGGLRTHSDFLRGGPVESQDGPAFLQNRWP